MIIINNLEDFKHVLSSINNGDYSNISLNDIIVTLYDDGKIVFGAEQDVITKVFSSVNDETIKIPFDWAEIFTVIGYDDNKEVFGSVVDYYVNKKKLLPTEQGPLQLNLGSLKWMIEE